MRQVFRFAVILVAAVALSGCDKCGDWFWQSNSQTPQYCKGGAGPSGR